MTGGVKVIRHLPSKINLADDPTLPYKAEIRLRPPEFMQVTFIMMYGGSEDLVLRGESREAINGFLASSGLYGHSRLGWIKLTGPDGTVEDISKGMVLP